MEAIILEIKNGRPVFEVHEGVATCLVGNQENDFHMIFDVKLGENFMRKVRLVSGGHKTNVPPSTCCASVVSRESVIISILDATLRRLDVLACDAQIACLGTLCRKKICCRVGI